MTTIDTKRTVAQLTQSVAGAARVFEKLGIDYCCRGRESLEQACEDKGLALDSVVDQLTQGMLSRSLHDAPRDPANLIHYILQRHHEFTRSEIARLGPLLEKVRRVHGGRHGELDEVASLFEALVDDLTPHMLKEEVILFPYIERLCDGEVALSPFGTVQNPVAMMHFEHEQVGALLAQLERATNGYEPPADGCGSFRALYAGLKELQADIHEHVHLENHVLFPAAIALEKELSASGRSVRSVSSGPSPSSIPSPRGRGLG